ncbi:hypothetical protein XA68_16865 [Ophiocordyceps unilateralis]|uniref:Killer toxin Kp4 domain-containing protein n=1 Tax=Ophiocordyceps unilateralis TaxID=268505 RepID=A0A2A9PK52_OPHUN|nr:hypothetical protein XA68_16865 [Ophiocordyceps unilateralis]
MKTFATTILLLCVAGAMAADCRDGLWYCGHTLRRIGDYQSRIDQAFVGMGLDGTRDGFHDLFVCLGRGANDFCL